VGHHLFLVVRSAAEVVVQGEKIGNWTRVASKRDFWVSPTVSALQSWPEGGGRRAASGKGVIRGTGVGVSCSFQVRFHKNTS